MKYLKTQEFKEKIFDFERFTEWKFNGEKPTIIYLLAVWCSPCKIMGPLIEELSDEYKDKIDIFKVDVDEESDIAVALNIRNIPAFLFIPKDQEPELMVGAMSKVSFIYHIEDLLKVKLEEK